MTRCYVQRAGRTSIRLWYSTRHIFLWVIWCQLWAFCLKCDLFSTGIHFIPSKNDPRMTTEKYRNLTFWDVNMISRLNLQLQLLLFWSTKIWFSMLLQSPFCTLLLCQPFSVQQFIECFITYLVHTWHLESGRMYRLRPWSIYIVYVNRTRGHD